jgi:hypothetical protein
MRKAISAAEGGCGGAPSEGRDRSSGVSVVCETASSPLPVMIQPFFRLQKFGQLSAARGRGREVKDLCRMRVSIVSSSSSSRK